MVATPIGNLDDLSPRAGAVLAEADRVLAEDTRRARILMAHAGARSPVVSLHGHNERRRIGPALDWLESGEALALVSDAGTPLLSDPGGRLVRETLAAGHRVVHWLPRGWRSTTSFFWALPLARAWSAPIG